MLIPKAAVVPVFFLVAFCLLLSFGVDFTMRARSFVAAAVAFATQTHAQTQYTSTGTAAVAAAKATAKTLSPTSSVPGKAFDRFVNIWLENTDYDMAAADRMIHFPATSPLLISSSITFMVGNPRNHTHQLPCNHPPKSTKLYRSSRWQHALGGVGLVLANLEHREDDRRSFRFERDLME